jgi:hypothetical protein
MSLPTFPRPVLALYDATTRTVRAIPWINPSGEDTTWEVHWGPIGGPYPSVVTSPVMIPAGNTAVRGEVSFVIPPNEYGERELKIHATNASGTVIGIRRAWVIF